MSKNRVILQEIILTFGFLNGLWIYAGVNPETEILKAFTELVPEMSSFLFWFISILLTVIPIVAVYRISKGIGLIALLLAFLGGIFIASWGIWLLIVAYLIGLYAPVSKRRI